MEFQQAGDGGSGGRSSDLDPGSPDGDKDAHSSSARSSGQEIRSTTPSPAHPEGNDHGDGDTFRHHPLENHTGLGSSSCQRDAGLVAPTESLWALATCVGQDALGQHPPDTTRSVWLPFFLGEKLEVDYIPFVVTGVSYHLGDEATSGHYCTAIKDKDWWWIFDDSKEPVKFSALPLVAQENSCLPWLNCTPHGGADEVAKMADESPILTEKEKMHNIIHDPTINDNWHGAWLRSLDLLDTKILVDNPSLCHRLVKCITCGSWPRDMNGHLQVAHRTWWNEAAPLAEKSAVSFISHAHPTRWCVCQPFFGTGLEEDHVCPCLRQFAILHLQLWSHQIETARALTLARLLDQTFS